MHGSNNNNCHYIGVKWMEPVTSRYPVNVAFVCLRSTDLKHCHAPISSAQMAFDNIALAYRVSPIATSAIKSWF